MTDQEKQQLKAELKDELRQEIVEELKNQKVKETKKFVLMPTRKKWINSNVLHKVFGDYTDKKIWERVNYLVARICDERRLDLISEADFANYAADKLCQTIYDLRVEFNEKYGGKD